MCSNEFFDVMALLTRNLLEETSIGSSLAVSCINECADVRLPDVELKALGYFLEGLKKLDERYLVADALELIETPMEEI